MKFAEVNPETLEIVDVYNNASLANQVSETLIEIPNNLNYQCIEAYRGENGKIRLRHTSNITFMNQVRKVNMQSLRQQRNTLLAETDKYVSVDFPHSRTKDLQAWLDYRQALRDLPSVTSDPSAPKWPTFGECRFIPRDTTFTGQQSCFITDDSTEEGMVVCANQNKYGTEGTPCSNAITINESNPNVSLCSTAMDKSCFGVISHTFAHKRAFINSVGEGAVWVVNTAGSLESGDYITTSNVAGYGQRQDDDILHNYTVAKITMDCDFEPATQPIQQILKELAHVNYWVKTTYSNVTQEEYSNLADENRTTTTETIYTNEDGEVNAEFYSNLESNVQSTYTELTRTVYQKIIKEESKTEQEGWDLEVRQELVNVLDEHGQLQWEDTDQTEKAYKIRYLDANGAETNEANAVHKAAFVGCTYHCG